MPPPSVPGPNDHDSLSDWEREVLAGIEDDLATSDPRLAKAMAGAAAGWRPLSWLSILALVGGLLVLVYRLGSGAGAVVGALRPVRRDGRGYVGPDALYREALVGLARRRGAADVAALLREYGWAEREQVGPAEYAARYLQPVGRAMPISEIERFVQAEKV
jgi:hypothetical protein